MLVKRRQFNERNKNGAEMEIPTKSHTARKEENKKNELRRDRAVANDLIEEK